MSEARPLTARQAEILAFCIRWLLDHHTTPPVRAICGRFGFRSTNGANDHIRALEAKGFLRRHRSPPCGACGASSGRDSNGLFILRHPDGRPFEITVK